MLNPGTPALTLTLPIETGEQNGPTEGPREADSIERFEGEGGSPTSPDAGQIAAGEKKSAPGAATLRIRRLEQELDAAKNALERAQHDVGALRQSEADLRKKEEFTIAILDELPPVLILNEDLCVVLANPSFYSHFRVTPLQTETRKIYDLGTGQWNIPKLRVLLEEVLPRNSFFTDFEITHDFPSLGLRTILLSGRRVDHLQKILIRIEDVTERLHFQAEMRRSEIRYRRLFETAKDGILIVDPETRRITDCNPFIMELLDYTRHEMLGKELWQIGLLADEEASQNAFHQLRNSGYIRYEDLPLESKNGLRREVEFVSNVYAENGPNVIQCNVRDISARKRTERALAEANDAISRHAAELEEHVAERTARLREAIGELGMFSYSVAHDMRAPLRAMEGFAHLLQEDFSANLPDEAKNHVAYIKAAAVRMDMLIQDVLTYTSVLHSDMKASVVDLDLLVRQVIQTYPELHAEGVTIKIEGLLPKVLGHPAAISQCISNVLTNAVKFVAPGTAPRVKVHAYEHRSHIRIWVEDNGIGIDPKDHKRIFGMFERLNYDYEGTGIGLAIVRKSIERLQGNVGVESALGKGSRFWMEFKRI